jgi:hypothetical protein
VRWGDGVQLMLLLAIPAGAAYIGLLLGRLIRGQPSMIERTRPRLVAGSVFLRDARDAGLSAHTRIRCAFEAIYFALLELAISQDPSCADREHPSIQVVTAGLSALDTPTKDRRSVELLTEWATTPSPFLPGLSPEEACGLAERIFNSTVTMLKP